MSIQNGERLATKQDLADFYNNIRPYMGGLVASKAGFTPIGTIISVMGTTAPVNYLACDGTVYNIADYTELANYFNEQFGSKNFFGGNGTTTFAVPDLRGEFLRGTGTNSHTNQGSGGTVGQHQDATNLHSTVINDSGAFFYGRYNSINIDGNYDTFSYGQSGTNYINKTGSDNSSDYQSSFHIGNITVRPTNTSVLYCIATKNFYIDPTLDYSTDEKVVGTWIDSRPIYQKTFHLADITTPIQSGNYKNVIIIDSGIDNIIGASGKWSYDSATGPVYLFPSYNNLCLIEPFLSNDGSVGISFSREKTGSAAIYNIYVTLLYTKTTT